MKANEIPILLLIFNRPETTKRVFEVIKQLKPNQLFVAADGPRASHQEDSEKCTKVRKYILDQIDWECELKTLFQQENLGCGLGPAKAISWFFDNVEEGIILEDDCLPGEKFFEFCGELLEKYRNDNRISIISGCNFDSNNKFTPTTHSYFYSAIPFTWGWATWKRNWIKYDYYIRKWKTINKSKILNQLFDEKEYQLYWKNIFDGIYINKPSDIWDYQFFFSCFLNAQLAIVPRNNLISNIGFGNFATHTVLANDIKANQPLDKLTFPLIHPQSCIRNVSYDIFLQEKCYGKVKYTTIRKRIKRNIKNIIRRTIVQFLEKLLIFVIPELNKLRNPEYDFGYLQSYKHDCTIDNLAILNKIYRFNNVKVGRRTYFAQNSLVQYTDIGKYCSIGPNFICGWGIHPTNGLSTSPMFYSIQRQNGVTLVSENKIEERKRITIGNDVFIGMNVIVLDGVTIGDGAIIGAGTVVSKDIPPYAIAIGSPVQIRKYRFDDETIHKLQKIAWWDFPEEKVKDVEKYFFSVNEFIAKHYES